MATPIRIVHISDKKSDSLLSAGNDYLARCRNRFATEVVAIKSSKDAQVERRATDEGSRLLQKTAGTFRVVMDEGGKNMSSADFAAFLDKRLGLQTISFCIGGADGHSRELVSQANLTMSFGALTLPHRLCFTILAEQIYRAQEIVRGGPYHKSRRP